MTGNRERAANVEVKCADLSANPYLLLTGLLSAGLDGIERRLELPEEITGDPAGQDAEETARRGIRRLPTTLEEAVAQFQASTLPSRAFGDLVVDAVVAVRRGEMARTAELDPAAVAEAYRWVY
jgi:glutamine synthetase